MTRRPLPIGPDSARRAPWQIQQGAACGCRGADDLCPCQNSSPADRAAVKSRFVAVSGDFVECDTCRALPGSPPLCGGCLHNRDLIGRLQRALNRSPES